MLGNRVAALVLQVRARQHLGVKRLLLGIGMGRNIDPQLFEGVATFLGVTAGVGDPFQHSAVPVVILFEAGKYIGHNVSIGHILFPTTRESGNSCIP